MSADRMPLRNNQGNALVELLEDLAMLGAVSLFCAGAGLLCWGLQ